MWETLGAHRKVEAFREHGERWLECKDCGAKWREVAMEEVVQGDGHCEDVAAEDEARSAMGEP